LFGCSRIPEQIELFDILVAVPPGREQKMPGLERAGISQDGQ
jgi:hypothetical protein